jgi:DinB family protein
MTTAIQRPDDTEYSPYFARYVNRVPEGDIVAQLRENSATLGATLAALDDARGAHRPEPGKWSIREMIGHLIDAERVFVYRALHIARGDTAPLSSFDQDEYAAAAGSDARPLSDLREELRTLRESTIRFFASLPDDAWTRAGVAGGNNLSVRAIAHIIVGHTKHHLQVLAERYDVPTIQ